MFLAVNFCNFISLHHKSCFWRNCADEKVKVRDLPKDYDELLLELLIAVILCI